MRCPDCSKGRMEACNEEYRYAECGLENVYLCGIRWSRCDSCGYEEAAIPRLGQLHRVIAWRLVTKPGLLNGKEIVFLRKQLGLKQYQFARLLGINQPELSRWETGERTRRTKPHDTLIRLAYALCVRDEFTSRLHQKLHQILVPMVACQVGKKVDPSPMEIDPSHSLEEEIESTLLEFGPVIQAEIEGGLKKRSA